MPRLIVEHKSPKSNAHKGKCEDILNIRMISIKAIVTKWNITYMAIACTVLYCLTAPFKYIFLIVEFPPVISTVIAIGLITPGSNYVILALNDRKSRSNKAIEFPNHN